MNKIDLIIDALEKYIAFTPSFYDVGKEALDAARELKALAQPESQATLYDVCQEILRLEAVQKELLEALKLAQSIIGHPDDQGSKFIAATIAKAEEN